VLNHAGSSVTAVYSHGHSTKLKLELLAKWAAHIEGLVSPKKPARRPRQKGNRAIS
jgi:hypothetical protein